jgi:hypothetical protein
MPLLPKAVLKIPVASMFTSKKLLFKNPALTVLPLPCKAIASAPDCSQSIVANPWLP